MNTTLSPADLRQRLVIVPEWISKVLEEAESAGKPVEYEYLETPFGRYPMAVRVAQ